MKFDLIRAVAVLSLSLHFFSPASAAQPVTDASIGKRLAEMFHVGFVRGPRPLQESHRIYDSLKNEAGTDARIDYAHGLVLLRQLKNKEAQAEFLTATKRSGPPYRPAWQALIWSHFVAKEYDEAYDLLIAYAKRLNDPQHVTDGERLDEVYWIGRMMSAQELLLTSPQARESWMQTEQRLADLIGAQAINTYNDGKEDMHIRHALIENKERGDRQKVEDLKAQKREKELERKGKVLEAADENREHLKRGAADSKENLEEQEATYKKQLQRAEKDLTFLERRATVLTSEMLVLDQQINLMQQAAKQNSNVNSGNAQRINTLLNARLLKDTEFIRVTALAQEVTTNARQLSEQRAEFLEQNQQTAGELAQREAANEKVKERTRKQVDNLKKPDSKPFISKTFRAYIDLDLFAERDKVLGSFGIKSEAK